MKSNRLITLALAATLCTAGFTSCGDDYDDTAIKGQIEDLDQRVTTLEEKVKADIAGIQAAIATLQGNDYVKAVKEIAGGYEITFSKGTVATIKNGKDGSNGTNGTNGTNGKDGVNGKDGKTPVLTAAKGDDGIYYWQVDGQDLMANGQKVPASRTPEFTAVTENGKTYWQIDDEFLMNNGQKVQATADAEPVKFDATVSDDKSTITFKFKNADETYSEYVVNVAKGELTITDANEGKIYADAAATYTVALPTGWTAGDLDVVRADVAGVNATGVAITRSAVTWTVAAAKADAAGATITVTGANIAAGDMAELTVTFVKKTSGEKLVGSTFLTAWAIDATPQTITADGAGNVATTIGGYPATHKEYSAITVDGTTAMTAADWAALKEYAPLKALVISNTVAGAEMPANAFENHPALESVDLTSSTFAAIPASAFAGCVELNSFTGIADIEEIGASAFQGCTKLATMNTVSGVTTLGASAFKGTALTTYPTFAAGMTIIPEGAFAGTGLTTPTLANVTTIGKEAFKDCASMTAVTLTAVTSVGESAFAGTGLTTVTFPAAVTAIGANAFDGCAITTVEFSVVIDFTGFDEAAFTGITGATKTLNFAELQQNAPYSGTAWKGIEWTTVNINGVVNNDPAA